MRFIACQGGHIRIAPWAGDHTPHCVPTASVSPVIETPERSVMCDSITAAPTQLLSPQHDACWISDLMTTSHMPQNRSHSSVVSSYDAG